MHNSFTRYPGNNILLRLTAVWAFNEAALGGILHALQVPFTGLLIGGFASLLISLIALNSDKRGVIIKSAIIVLIIKGILAPHTPLAAYFAVALQALFGELLFLSRRNYKLSAFSLSVIVAVLSSVQKIFMLTVIYGTGLWNALDAFAVYIVNQFITLPGRTNFPAFSTIVISLYMFLHLAGGVFFGILAVLLPGKITGWAGKYEENLSQAFSQSTALPAKRRRRFRVTRYLLFIFIIVFAVVSYFDSDLNKYQFYEALTMLIRSTAILLLWYFAAAPMLLRVVKRFFNKKESKYKKEIETIIDMFPAFKAAFAESRRFIKNVYGLKKVTTFISLYLTLLLFSKDTGDEAYIRTDG